MSRFLVVTTLLAVMIGCAVSLPARAVALQDILQVLLKRVSSSGHQLLRGEEVLA